MNSRLLPDSGVTATWITFHTILGEWSVVTPFRVSAQGDETKRRESGGCHYFLRVATVKPPSLYSIIHRLCVAGNGHGDRSLSSSRGS